MDAARLNEAVEFMKAHETASPARDFSDQEVVNGKSRRSSRRFPGSSSGSAAAIRPPSPRR
jgi:hypothetical protein